MKSWRKQIKATDRVSPFERGGYHVRLGAEPGVTRPTKSAAGMQYTSRGRRKKQYPKADALRLIVHGTNDKLVNGLKFKVVPGCCPTCGHKTAGLVLTDRGRLRLRVMRRRAQDRKEKADA